MIGRNDPPVSRGEMASASGGPIPGRSISQRFLPVLGGSGEGFATPVLTLFGIAALAVSVKDLARQTDSVATFANAVALIWLVVALSCLLTGRGRGLTRVLLVAWIVLGVLRGTVSLLGVPTGWNVTQTIEAQGRSSSTQTHMAALSFRPGEVPAHLINDTARFNFRSYDDGVPDRNTLPVALTARSYVAGEGTLIISSSSPIRIAVGEEVTELRPPIVEYRRGVSVSREEVVEIAMEPTGVDKASLDVRPAGLSLYSEPTEGQMMSVRRLLGRAVDGIDLATAIAGLALALVMLVRVLALLRPQRLFCLSVVAFALFLMVTPHTVAWISQHDSLWVLSGGDDWLTYESFSRDIRLNSPLMLSGKPVGKADAFYYQPLYPYVLALGHLFVGESAQGIVMLQLLGAGLILVLSLFALPAEVSAAVTLVIVALGSGILQEWTLLAERLLSENLMLLVLALLLFLVSRLRPVPSPAAMAVIGAILGVAGLARSTAWVAVPLILLILLRGMPRRMVMPRAVVMLVPIMLLALLVPARNLVAAGTPALLPTSGSINLYMGVVPSGRKLTGEPWTELAKTHDPRLVAVAEVVVNAPDQVAKKFANKALYVLGFPRTLDPDNPPVFWPVLSLWLLAPLGLLRRTHSNLAWTCLILAVTHALSLILIFPDNYYYRLVMPATLPLLIWDVLALNHLIGGLNDPSQLGERVKGLAKALTGILGKWRPEPQR